MRIHVNKTTINDLRNKIVALCDTQKHYETSAKPKASVLNLYNWYKISTINSIFIPREYEIRVIDINLENFLELEYRHKPKNLNKVIFFYLENIRLHCDTYKRKYPKRRIEAICWLSKHLFSEIKKFEFMEFSGVFFKPSTDQLKNNPEFTQDYTPEYSQDCAKKTVKLFSKLNQTNVAAINGDYFDRILTDLSNWRKKHRPEEPSFAMRRDKIHDPQYYSVNNWHTSLKAYKDILKMAIDATKKIGDKKETINFGPLKLEMTTKVDVSGLEKIWTNKIKYTINDNSETEFIPLSVITIRNEKGTKQNNGCLMHPDVAYVKKLIPLLGLLFKLCCSPTCNKRNKLIQIATFEWIMQQATIFTRSTPTITKVIVCALLLLHGFRPIYNCDNNDMNCFASFTHNLTRYLKIWVKNNPFIPDYVTLL